MKPGTEIIAEERRRQIDVEGWTPENDALKDRGELAIAAAFYAIPENERRYKGYLVPQGWPFHFSWWKPSPNDRIRELAKAGALIAAEIDRLQTEDD